MSEPKPASTMRRAALAVLAAAVACSGIETGNAVHAALQLKVVEGGSSGAALSAQDSGPSGADSTGTRFTINSATGYVRHIQLDLPEGLTCEELQFTPAAPVSCSSGKVTVQGPFLVDLVAGTATPSLADVVISSGSYKRVDVRFDDADPSDGLVPDNDPMDNLTLLVKGTFPYQSAETTFEVRLRFNEDARFESTAGIEIAEDGARTALMGLDVAQWFAGSPITTCLDRGDLTLENGKLLIDDNERSGRGDCSGFEEGVKTRMKNSGRLR